MAITITLTSLGILPGDDSYINVLFGAVQCNNTHQQSLELWSDILYLPLQVRSKTGPKGLIN